MKKLITFLLLLCSLWATSQPIHSTAFQRPFPASETLWDLSTASYDSKSFSTAGQTGATRAFYIKPDGTAMYVTDGTSIYQYTISTTTDISTASYASISFNASAQVASAWGISFYNNGSKMYIADFTNNAVFQYTLGTPWNVSTASYDSKSLTIASGGVTDIFMKGDGLKIVAMTYGNQTVTQYNLSTPGDLSTASTIGTFSFATQETSPIAFFMSASLSKLYASGWTNNTAYQYTLGTPGTISTASYDSKQFVLAQGTNCDQLFMNGNKMYVYQGQTIYQYSIN